MKTNSARDYTVTIAFMAFVGLGLASGLLGVAWPSIQNQFGLPLDAVSVIYLLQTAGYTLASFAIGRLMARWGSGMTLLVGLGCLGACMFGIAASATWLVVVAFAFLVGLGGGIVDAGLNLYLATYHSARQMNWLHACFGIGITFGPLVMTFVLERKLPWQTGYAIAGVPLVVLSLLVAATLRQWRTEGFQTAEHQPVRRAGFAETLRVPVVWLSMATFIIYMGVEIGIGQWAYVILTQARAMAPGIAGPWISAYWGAFTGGRILFGFVADRFEIRQVLRYAMLSMVLGVLLFWWNPTIAVSLLGLVVVGFAQAPLFPMLMTDTAPRVGAAHAENTIGLQMGAVGIGGAILPGLLGAIGDDFGLEMISTSFVLLAVVLLILHELSRQRRVVGAAPTPLG